MLKSKGTFPRGLYAITDSNLMQGEELFKKVESALQGGAVMVQYRDKGDDSVRREQEASTLLNICKRYSAPLIINDDVQLAKKIAANGVHLGTDDASLEQARSILGQESIIGVSCYNSLDRAITAQFAGADYVAFGSFYLSEIKPQAVKAEIEVLHQARDRLNIPVVAIGGITFENGKSLVQAGADMLAVISGIFAESDISGTARQFKQLFA